MIDWDMLLFSAICYVVVIIPLGIIGYGMTLITQLTMGDLYGGFVIISGVYWLGVAITLICGS